MSENSKIEWTDHTFNPWEGCQEVSPGCDNCYAETRNARFAVGTAMTNFRRASDDSAI
jgi:protein gp37